MITADFRVVLDACVLANFAVCDLLLSLAETPRQYLPRWSHTILEETHATQIDKLGWPQQTADNFRRVLLEHFPAAMVADYEYLIDQCTNDPKDRHVLACAIHSKAELIVTYNLKDFQKTALNPWGIQAQHPQEFLLARYSMHPVPVLHCIETIAKKRGVSTEDHLIELGKFTPAFSQKILSDLS